MREQRVLEVRVDPVADALRVDLEVGGDAPAGGRALVVGLAAEGVGRGVAGEARLVGLDEGAPLVGRRLVYVAAGDRREQAVGALVDDLEGGGVAGLGRQHDARGELGRDFLDLDGGALLLPAAQRLVLGQEVTLERELRQATVEVELVGRGEGAVVDVDQRVVERARRCGDGRR